MGRGLLFYYCGHHSHQYSIRLGFGIYLFSLIFLTNYYQLQYHLLFYDWRCSSTDHNPVACQSIKISESYDATAADGFDEPRTTDTSSVKTIRRIASSSSISGVSSSAWRFLTSLVPPLSPLNTNKNQKRLSTNIRVQRQQKIKTSGSSC